MTQPIKSAGKPAIESVFSGRVVQVDVERVCLPNGQTAELEIIRHPGGAAVVALDAEGRVCLLRQYRHAAGGYLWELPAGKIDHGEPPLATAQRELEEEGGVRAARWESLGDYVSSPGVFTETVHLYLAQDLEAVATRHEAHEVLEIHWLPFASVLEMAHSGALRDGKSLVGIFRAAGRLQPGRVPGL